MKRIRPALAALIVVLTIWLGLSPSGGAAAPLDPEPYPLPVWEEQTVENPSRLQHDDLTAPDNPSLGISHVI